MRIAQLTPGTGHFVCGTCVRDQALARSLRRRGHDVQVVPLYLPSYPDDPGLSAGAPVQMGAVSLYLRQQQPWLGRLLRPFRALLDSPPLLRWVARRGTSTDPTLLGEMTVAMLQGTGGPFGGEIARMMAWFESVPRPDVVCLSNVMLCGLARSLRERVGVPVVCTLQGENPFVDALREPYRGEAWRLLAERAPEVHAFVAVSRHHAAQMAGRLGLPPERVKVVLNGVAVVDDGGAPRPPAVPTIGYLARMCAAKGLPLLVEAFIRLRAANRVGAARLRIAGVELAEDRALVHELRRRLATAGLDADVEFLPNLPDQDKRLFLRSLSVFSVPANREESFGLYVLEAMAEGVPVVEPRHAAFPEILGATGGGMLCDADDPGALAAALEAVLLDPVDAGRMGERGRRAVREQFTAERMARDVEVVLAEVCEQHRSSAR